MTIEQRNEFYLGRDYWQQYIKINGYAFYPTDKGLLSLSKNLDINVKHLRACINSFLSA
jgi:hypothetical protein